MPDTDTNNDPQLSVDDYNDLKLKYKRMKEQLQEKTEEYDNIALEYEVLVNLNKQAKLDLEKEKTRSET